MLFADYAKVLFDDTYTNTMLYPTLFGCQFTCCEVQRESIAHFVVKSEHVRPGQVASGRIGSNRLLSQ